MRNAIELAVATLMADVIKEQRDNLRESLAKEFKEIGADSTKVKIDDVTIGKISLVEPKPKAYIQDEYLFTQWVVENYPHEIMQVVREAFKKKILDMVEFDENGRCFLSETGEVVAGLNVKQTEAYVSTRFEKDGRENLANALRNDKVSFNLPYPTVRQEIGA